MSYERDKKYHESREACNKAHRIDNHRYYAKTPVERATNGGTRWTEKEVNVLTHWVSDDLALAQFLGRTIRAVQKKRYELKRKGY